MAIRDRIIRKLSRIDDLPTFPEVAMRVRQKLQEAEAGASDIAVIVENDPALASRILKIANSPVYNFGECKFGNVRQAIVRMGLSEVAKLTVAMGVMNVFKISDVPKNYFKEFWTHSIMVALTTKEIIACSNHREKNRIDVSNAFTAGLFHAIGRLILCQYFPAYFIKIFRISRSQDMELHEIEEHELGIDHAEIGALVLERWKLPGFICDSVMYQYDPDSCKPETKIYAQAVNLANFAVSCNGNPLPEGNIPRQFCDGAWFDFELDEDIDELIERVKTSEEIATIMVTLGLN